MVKTDIVYGAILEEEFKTMLESATEKYINCTKALEKQL